MKDENTIMTFINSILSHGVDGIGPLQSSQELALSYQRQSHVLNDDDMVDSMIKWESSKSFGTGFVTGLGGVLTLPVNISASLYASWVVQSRLAGAIAHIYGYDVHSEQVRTFILLALIGDGAKDILKGIGIEIGEKIILQAIKKIPGHILIEINKKVGFRLITKAGEKGVINLTKSVPFLGGFIGGSIDAASTYTVGKTAQLLFKNSSKGNFDKDDNFCIVA